jgi:hypothetical protein
MAGHRRSTYDPAFEARAEARLEEREARREERAEHRAEERAEHDSGNLVSDGVDVAVSVVDDVADLAAPVIEPIVDVVSDVADEVTPYTDAAAYYLEDAATSIVDTVGGVPDALASAAEDVLNTAGDTASDVLDVAAGVASDPIGAAGEVLDAGAGFAGDVVDAGADLAGDVFDAGESAAQGVGTFIEMEADAVAAVGDVVVGAGEDAIDAVVGVGEDLIDAGGDALDSAVDFGEDVVDDILGGQSNVDPGSTFEVDPDSDSFSQESADALREAALAADRAANMQHAIDDAKAGHVQDASTETLAAFPDDTHDFVTGLDDNVEQGAFGGSGLLDPAMVGSGAAGAGDVLAPDGTITDVAEVNTAPAFGADVSLNPQPIPPGVPDGEMDDTPSVDDGSIIIVGGDEPVFEEDLASALAEDASGPAFGAFAADDGPTHVSISEDEWDS